MTTNQNPLRWIGLNIYNRLIFHLSIINKIYSYEMKNSRILIEYETKRNETITTQNIKQLSIGQDSILNDYIYSV